MRMSLVTTELMALYVSSYLFLVSLLRDGLTELGQ